MQLFNPGAAVVGEARPFGQLVQALVAVVSAYFPGMHAWHVSSVVAPNTFE